MKQLIKLKMDDFVDQDIWEYFLEKLNLTQEYPEEVLFIAKPINGDWS